MHLQAFARNTGGFTVCTNSQSETERCQGNQPIKGWECTANDTVQETRLAHPNDSFITMSMQHNETIHNGAMLHNHGKAIGNDGLLLSHSILGTFVFGLGLWWWISAVRRRYSTIRRPNGKYEATVSIESGCCPNLIGEGLVKLVLCCIGLATEAVSVHMGRHPAYAHYPFYAAMLIAALVDILQSTVLFLPDRVDYMCHVLPFVLQAFYLRAQAYDQPHVTATSRLISSYLGVLAAAGIATEMEFRNTFLFSWTKCLNVMVSGAWTWQMAIILDQKAGQAWSEESHENVMYAAIAVAWQMFGVALLQLITLLIGAKCSGVTPYWTDAQGSAERHRSSCSANLRHDVQYTKLLSEEPSEE
ncbi:hypothetical protein CSKR_104006 [Clonorchis sinensis]|uniref:Uncharacterized protein n=1 Tax=Clonorchis sinensis TaxID=79923 RepID=A0A419QA81_CLOSI|nr:hypothetical protein CSKR_104006 [Clonorchis sinensis]